MEYSVFFIFFIYLSAFKKYLIHISDPKALGRSIIYGGVSEGSLLNKE